MEKETIPTALLVMDMQSAILPHIPDNAGLIDKVSRAMHHAREKKIPVIYVRVGFRNGVPEISTNNKGFVASKERFLNTDMDEFLKIDPALAPQPGEVVVTKRRVSAFTGSDLEVVLRAFRVQHLVLTGIATSGVVLSTVREAADKDFRLTVLSDGCADGDQEVHQVLMNKVFPRQADLLTVAEWTALPA